MILGNHLRKTAIWANREKYKHLLPEISKGMTEQAELGGYRYKFVPKEPINETILLLLKHEFQGIDITEWYQEIGTDGYYYYEFDWKGAK